MTRSLPSHIAAQFLSRIDRSGGSSACWPYVCNQVGSPYLRFSWTIDGVHYGDRAHRIAFLLHNGHLPKGRSKESRLVRHTCDNPRCCNPSHLIEGTQKQNIEDAIARRRHVPPPHKRGESHWRARLTRKDVIKIRRALSKGQQIAALARQYQVGETTVRHIRDRTSWGHV